MCLIQSMVHFHDYHHQFYDRCFGTIGILDSTDPKSNLDLTLTLTLIADPKSNLDP